ncbi:MAG: amidohydrolase, partial [Croceitalea sp.]|nr:amidohydrolase [Croceitalea sp.]
MKKLLFPLILGLLATFGAIAQKSKEAALSSIDAKAATYGDIAMQIWNLAEMGYQEEKSSRLLQETLAAEGFAIEKGVANIPTAFVAEYGNGGPIIA